MKEFKVNDKVKRIKNFGPWEKHFDRNHIGTVTRVDEIGDLEIDNETYMGDTTWVSNCFELVQPFTKQDLKERYLLITRNGNQYMISNHGIKHISKKGKFTKGFIDLKNYNDDLTDKNKREWDIVQVLKPQYETIFERTEPTVKEMTVSEISKALGYEVKIVKE